MTPKLGSQCPAEGGFVERRRNQESLGKKSWLRLLPPRPGVGVTASSRGRRAFRAARSNVDYLGMGLSRPQPGRPLLELGGGKGGGVCLCKKINYTYQILFIFPP